MTTSRSDLFFYLLAGLWGFIGVLLLAAGAHADASGRLNTAGMFLLFHATACLGLIYAEFMGPKYKLNTLLLLMMGSGVFAADICSRVLRGEGLLPNLAPTGGVVTMLGWLGVVGGASMKLLKRPHKA
jgi:uncharacterized membrane protein YgdD (TMEM256/DUF423 family)